MRSWTTESVSLAEEMVRSCLGLEFRTLRFIRKSTKAPLLSTSPIRIVDISGTILTEKGEARLKSSAVIQKERRRWVPKYVSLEALYHERNLSWNFPVCFTPDGIGFQRVTDPEKQKEMSKYHPSFLQSPRHEQ